VMSCHLIWLLSVNLGSWSCWLWYHHPLWVLTVLAIQYFGLLLCIYQYHCEKENQGGKGWHLAISYDCSALNWDCGLVDCGTNMLCGCWLFWQNEIQVYCCASFNIIAGKRIRGERGDVSPFNLIA
jgi:hypothetical protein